MSKKYREELEKITVSPELKEKILRTAPVRAKRRRQNVYKYASLAACFALCAAAIGVSQNLYRADLPPEPEITPPLTAVSPAPTASPIPAASPAPAATAAPTQAPAKSHTPAQTPAPTAAPSATAPAASDTPAIPAASPDAVIPPATAAPEPTEPPAGSAPDVSDPPELALPPFYDAADIADAQNAVGYAIRTPGYLPEGYRTEAITVLFGNLVQISYTCGDAEILYRTERTDDADISGDYNRYDEAVCEIGGSDVTLRSEGGQIRGAIWSDGECAYSVSSTDGLARDEIVKIIESVK